MVLKHHLAWNAQLVKVQIGKKWDGTTFKQNVLLSQCKSKI